MPVASVRTTNTHPKNLCSDSAPAKSCAALLGVPSASSDARSTSSVPGTSWWSSGADATAARTACPDAKTRAPTAMARTWMANADGVSWLLQHVAPQMPDPEHARDVRLRAEADP